MPDFNLLAATIRHRLGLMALAGLLVALLCAPLPAQRDSITTMNGVTVDGRITSETKDEVVIETDRFGVLHFRKLNIRTIQRASQRRAGSPSPAPGGDPFSGFNDPFAMPGGDPFSVTPPANSGGADPFSGGPVDPFSGLFNDPAPSPGRPTNTAPADPFGMSQPPAASPFGHSPAGPSNRAFNGNAVPLDQIRLLPEEPGASAPRGASQPRASAEPFDPFAVSDDPFAASPRAQAPVQQAALREAPPPSGPSIPTLPPRSAPPVVRPGYDAVVYGLSELLSVDVKTPAAGDWRAATDDTQLQSGSEVRTNQTPSSRLLLRGKNDELRLPDQSHIQIERMSDDSEEVVINLRAGSIWSEVSPRNRPDAFQIRTPELTAGVRGTNFRVDRLAGASRVSVFSGIVHVIANTTGTHVTLRENQSAVVNLHGQILDLIAIPRTEQEIYDDWDQWAMEASFGSGAMAASFSPIAGLSQQIASDNARWEADMQEHMQNVAEMRYMDKLEEYAQAFLRLADDTGYIPDTEEGWSMMKFDPGLPGWNGPYVEGPVPPLDPWKRPLVYRKVVSQTGRTFGRVYSVWRDGIDQGGVNSSLDKAALILYYQLERFEDDPAVNP